MRRDKALRIVVDEFKAAGWSASETPGIDDRWNLADRNYSEPCKRTELELRVQCRKWIESFDAND